MRKNIEYICPKCGNNNWKVGETRGFEINPDNRTCGDCGYKGTFLIKEKIINKNRAK